MATYPVPRRFPPKEYLKIGRAAPFKSEHVDGQIYALAGSTRGHNSIALDVALSLRMRLKGKGCTTHTSDVRISVSKAGPYFYHDFLVVCNGDSKPDWRKDTVAKPILIGEVHSDSTARYDQNVFPRTPSCGAPRNTPTSRRPSNWPGFRSQFPSPNSMKEYNYDQSPPDP